MRVKGIRFLTVFVLLGAFLAVAPSAGGASRGLERAMEVQDRHSAALLDRPGVHGNGVTVTEGGTAAIVVFAERSAAGSVPRRIEDVPVVVQVTGGFFALHHRTGHDGGPPGGGGGDDGGDDGGDSGSTCTSTTSRCDRPVPIGISTGNVGECSAGTIGARVSSGSDVYALSNNHVYALENDAPIGSAVLQPGRYDTGCSWSESDVIGTLADYVPINFDGPNEVDAAIASTSTDQLGTATPADGYGTPSSTTLQALVNMSVQKYGRTTQLTSGTITSVNTDVNVGYSGGTALFVEQIIVQSTKPFIKGGDSGSLLVTSTGNSPVGLLFAGNMSGKYAVANHIGDVLSAFGVSIDGA